MRTSAKCGAQAVFWPDVEACEAECMLPKGHDGRHEDKILGTWEEDDLHTIYPPEPGR